MNPAFSVDTSAVANAVIEVPAFSIRAEVHGRYGVYRQVSEPYIGHSFLGMRVKYRQRFIFIGSYDTKEEAEKDIIHMSQSPTFMTVKL